MKLLQFLAEKVVIVEVMLIILNVSMLYFGLSLPLLTTFLVFLTPIAVIALILYIILALLNSRLVQTALGVVLGGIILYYLFRYILT
jgi:hypothetical protein